jgi:Outer membrane protein W
MKTMLLAAAGAVALTGFAAPAAFAEAGDWQFRLRASTVQPDESGGHRRPFGGDVSSTPRWCPEFEHLPTSSPTTFPPS